MTESNLALIGFIFSSLIVNIGLMLRLRKAEAQLADSMQLTDEAIKGWEFEQRLHNR